MKSKTLALVTAALITVAALILTASLSLLNSSAIDDSVAESTAESGSLGIDLVGKEEAPEADAPIVEEQAPEADAPIVDEQAPEADAPVVDEQAPEADKEAAVELPIGALGNPVFPASDEYDGSELIEDHSAPCYIDDVVIAIYEHATGELVGQVTFTDDQIWEDVNQLHLGVYQKGNCVYDPADKDSVPVCIPNGKYRVEVYAIWYADDGGCGTLFFAYTYGTNELMEMWKHGVLYSGCQEFIAYTDALIADEMAAIEAGTNVVPSLEETVTYICGFGAEKVTWNAFEWTGDFHKTYEASRGTPRFPYLETEE